jgi:Transglycosylase SLT domain
VSSSRNRYRKPSRLTLAVAGATVTASITVGAALVAAGPASSINQAAALQSAGKPALGGTAGSQPLATLATYTQMESLLRPSRSRLALNYMRRVARAQRIAAARRADRRADARAAQQRAAMQAAAAPQPAGSTGSATAQASGAPQQIAAAMLGSFGWPSGEFGCLQSLWNAESGWNPYASNPSSGAYGIPQALPGSKMASAGPDWQTNPATQIRWGLGYIKQLYGSPCGAWSHEQSAGWY